MLFRLTKMSHSRVKILLVLLCLLQRAISAHHPGCEDCGCCVDKVCARSNVKYGWRDDVCTYGCIDGFGGNKCYNKCPDDCVTCEQTTVRSCKTCENGKYLSTVSRTTKSGTRPFQGCVDCPARCTTCTSGGSCQECADRYYNTGQYNDCSEECPKNCKKCTSSTNCQECYSPYYNDGTTTDCSLSCPGNCLCSTPGVCSSCKEGYFNTNEDCMTACPDTCTACLDQNECHYCHDGYFNGRASSTDNDVTDCSLPCRDTCSRCTSYDFCTSCKQGHYGTYCQENCSAGCRNGECNTIIGTCECTYGFTGRRCSECETGRHGEQCDKKCPNSCKDNVCTRETGYCINCKSSNIAGETCDKCINSMWGAECLSTCPQHCMVQCVRDTGHCVACTGNFKGHTCNECELGYHGDGCDKKCPERCLNSNCYQSNGTCRSCTVNYSGPTCGTCVTGMYGQFCDIQCRSANCFDNICNRDNGNCVSCQNGFHGLYCDLSCSQGCIGDVCEFGSGACECKEHYTGDKCCVDVGHCRNCSSNTVCETCADGYFGTNCNIPCPSTCAIDGQDTHCEMTDGKCSACPDGVHGDHCNMTCSERCANGRCHKENGHCVEGCAGDFEGPTCTHALPVSKSIVPGVIGGVAGAVITIAIVIVVIVVLRRRRTLADSRKDYIDDSQNNAPPHPGPSNRRHYENKAIYANDGPELAELEPDIDGGDGEEIVVEVQGPQSESAVYENVPTAPVSGLDAFVRRKSDEKYKQEFEQLPKGLTQSHNDSRKPENVVKNRFNGIYPYDHSRVKIKGDPEFFINACFIDGFQQKNKYIASLGPTAKTTLKFHTFWTMVWHIDTDVIVMLTNLIEPSGNKCEQYWPNQNCTNVHQDITVSCHSEEVYAEYTVRTLTVEKKLKKRTVVQLHYTAWPDKSIPDEITSLVEFRQRVRSTPRVHHGPIIIHCSAGIGRTGTYIALDRLTEAGEAGDIINIYDCVYDMRQQRVHMVQTLEQYKFLHKALVHTLTFQSGAIRAEEFGPHIRATSDLEFNAHFELLKIAIDDEAIEELQARNKNRRQSDKNRMHSDIPGDRHRPRIHICRTFNSSDYINAIYVNGFNKKDQYIIAQSPLLETVVDFLCLIFQENCYCVVSMEDAELIGTEIGDYLGTDNQVFQSGTFTVKARRSETGQNYIMKKLTISNGDKHSKEEKVVYHYQLTNWRNDEQVPAGVGEFTRFVKDVSIIAGEMRNINAPILVHCLDGAKRSGLFCAVGILIEKIEAEGQVSVPNTLRQLRTRRKMAIPNKEQFEFCYRSVDAHVNTNNVYSNFAR